MMVGGGGGGGFGFAGVGWGVRTLIYVSALV